MAAASRVASKPAASALRRGRPRTTTSDAGSLSERLGLRSWQRVPGARLCGSRASPRPCARRSHVSDRDLSILQTLRFQQTILSILPNAVFILLAALRLGFLRHKPCRLDRPFDALIAVKAVLCSLLVASSAAVIAKLSNVTGLPDTTLAAHALALVASVRLASC